MMRSKSAACLTEKALPVLMLGALILGVFVLGVSEADAQRRRQTGRRLPMSSALQQAGLERLWWAQAGFNPAADKLKSISVDEENVYIVSERGSMTAFNGETGTRLWVYLIGGDNAPVLAPVSNSTQVLAAVGRTLVALDKFSGAVQWRIDLPGQPSTGPAVDDSNVYVGTLDGRVYAYNLRKIRQLFNDGKLPDYSYNALVWTYAAPSDLSSPPATTGRSVDFASRSGVFTSVSASDRTLQFLFETDGQILAPVTRSGKYAIVPSTDRNVYCLDRRNGQVEWTFASGLPVTRPVSLVGESIYVSPGELGLFQLDLENGRRQWAQPRARQFIASTATSIYASDSLNNVLVLDPKSGSIKSTLRLSLFDSQVANNRTDRLILATSTGLVMSLRESGREFPTYHRYPERRPLIPTFASDVPADTDSATGNE